MIDGTKGRCAHLSATSVSLLLNLWYSCFLGLVLGPVVIIPSDLTAKHARQTRAPLQPVPAPKT